MDQQAGPQPRITLAQATIGQEERLERFADTWPFTGRARRARAKQLRVRGPGRQSWERFHLRVPTDVEQIGGRVADLERGRSAKIVAVSGPVRADTWAGIGRLVFPPVRPRGVGVDVGVCVEYPDGAAAQVRDLLAGPGVPWVMAVGMPRLLRVSGSGRIWLCVTVRAADQIGRWADPARRALSAFDPWPDPAPVRFNVPIHTVRGAEALAGLRDRSVALNIDGAALIRHTPGPGGRPALGPDDGTGLWWGPGVTLTSTQLAGLWGGDVPVLSRGGTRPVSWMEYWGGWCPRASTTARDGFLKVRRVRVVGDPADLARPWSTSSDQVVIGPDRRPWLYWAGAEPRCWWSPEHGEASAAELARRYALVLSGPVDMWFPDLDRRHTRWPRGTW